ncbi:MAG: hypothetical protein ACE5GX_06595 [Thermoanaerobaculia bacterium]
MLGAVFLAALCGCSSKRRADRRSEVWFDDLIDTTAPAEEQLLASARWLQARLLGGADEPPIDLVDTRPRLVFLSLTDGSGLAQVLSAGGHGLAQAVSNAAMKAEAIGAGRAFRYLKVDVVDRVDPISTVERRGLVGLERGLQGIAFEGSSNLAFLPEEVVAWTLVNSDREMRASNIEKYLRRRGAGLEAEVDRVWHAGTADLWTFTTRSFFADARRLTPLQRGHPRLHRVTPDEMWTAARAAGEYLRRNVTSSGRFVYSYLPKTDRTKDGYNILRHAGTVYSMLELYEVTGDVDLLAAADRALEFLRSQIEPCAGGKETEKATSCVVEKGYVKLGGNALAILALAKRAEVLDDPSELIVMQRLGRWITGVQKANGEFAVHKQNITTGKVEDFVSGYYPGEALFALARLHGLDQDPAWLDAASAGASFLISARDAGLADSELSHDHWLLYALEELHRRRPRELFLDHALRLASVIVAAQNREPEPPDWQGSYYRPPRSTPTATRSEGLCAAYDLARATGRMRDAEEILEAVRQGIDFQVQTQFGPESVMYLRDPRRALGGFHRSLTDFEIRIDYVQHNLSSLLCARRLLAR